MLRPLRSARHFAALLTVGLGVFLTVAFTAAPALAVAPAPETPTTGAVRAITGTSAAFEGVLNPGTAHEPPQSGSYEFLYKKLANGAGCEGELATPAGGMSGLPEQPVSEPVGLEPATKYAMCLVATNESAEPTVGNVVSFETKKLKPKVTPASEKVAGASVTSTEATFEASINPNNEKTTYGFEYATTEAALLGLTGTKVAGTLPPELEGDSEVPISVTTAAPLAPGTTYFYRADATNPTGTGYGTVGTVESFTTVPLPTAEAPTLITAETATLNGKLTSLNEKVPTEYHFDYNLGATCAGGAETAPENTLTASGTKAVSADLVTLQPNATYAVCLVATNEYAAGSFGSDTSAPVSFKTLAVAPTFAAGSESVSEVKPTVATLHATINPQNQETKYQFEYSTKGKTGAGEDIEAPIVNVPSPAGTILAAFEEHAVEAPTDVLTPATTYYYRVTAENAKGEKATPGAVQSFTSAPEAPETLGPAKTITATTAVLEGVLNPKAEANTGWYFDYSTEAKCTENPLTSAAEPEALLKKQTESKEVTELQPNKKYEFCLVAFNAGGAQSTPAGNEVSLTTKPAAPKIDGESTPVVGTTNATFEAQVNPNNEKTKYTFEYSTTGTEGPAGSLTGTIVKKNGLTELPEVFGDQPASVSVTGLEAAKKYYYRVVATNAAGTTTDPTVESFTTNPAVPPTITPESENVSGSGSPIEASFGAAINPNGQKTAYEFEYSTEGSVSGNTLTGTIETVPGAPPAGELEGFGEQGVGSASTGPVLEPGQVYYYRVVATNGSGTTKGAVQLFSKAPIVEGESSSNLTSTGVKLEATVNPYFQPTSYAFEYSTEGTAGHAATETLPATMGTITGATKVAGAPPAPLLPGEFAGLPASVEITGLTPGRIYYYRVVAENETTRTPGNKVQPSTGEVTAFQALDLPAVTVTEAQNITQTTATFSGGTVNPAGAETKYDVAYVEAAKYEPGAVSGNPYENGKTTPQASAGSGYEPQALAAVDVSELKPSTTYDYAIIARNSVGRTIGQIGTFTTAPATPPPGGAGPNPGEGGSSPSGAGGAGGSTGSLPAVIPFQSIAEIEAKEAKEDKGIQGPAGTGTKSLTRSEKLHKALKACHKKKGSKRQQCEKAAQKSYGPAKKGKK
jgi:phosphodiesterase/alkaline phosphatase D-like protein